MVLLVLLRVNPTGAPAKVIAPPRPVSLSVVAVL
jgi:hypothetical protein